MQRQGANGDENHPEGAQQSGKGQSEDLNFLLSFFQEQKKNSLRRAVALEMNTDIHAFNSDSQESLFIYYC